jgi:glycosyltransferase involved in cell wall biosynthesis
MPRLRATILGDGPERPRVVEVVRGLGVEDTIEMPGFVPEPELTVRLRSALCLVLPSRRRVSV